MHILEQWKIDAIERKADEAVRRLYEIDALRSDLGRLECSLRDASAEASSFRSRCSDLEEKVRRLEEQVDTLMIR